MLCLACGANLAHIRSGYKGRLNHIKRCSKSRGVTIKDLIVIGDDDDDYDDLVVEQVKSAAAPAEGWKVARSSTIAAPGSSSSTGKVRTLHEMLMAGARRAAKTEQIKKQARQSRKRQKGTAGGTGSGGGGGTFSKRSYTKCPHFKMIPGTDFCVDGFQYANAALTSNYFLTHFHADHYGGLDKNWSAGIIYCNSITATLVHEQLRVDRQYLHPLPLHEPTVLASRGVPITVTLLNANHCPGAVMMLFTVKHKTILHVGDFRWNYQIMNEQAALRPFCRLPWSNGTSAQIVDELFLDTTYCNPKYDLPTQAECIQGAVDKAVKEVEEARLQKQRLLMIFGSYTIGKEAVRVVACCCC
jgi:Metallo-beta-lactamase superfamily